MPSTLISFTQSVDRILAAIEGVDFAGITRELREAVDTLGKAVTDMKVAEVQKEFVGLVKDLRTTTQLVTALLDKSKAPANAAVTVDLAKVMQSLDEILQSLDREVDGAKVAELRKGVADLVAEVRQTNQSVKSLVDESRNQLKTADIPKRMARLDKTLKRLERLAASQQSDIEAILDNFRQVSANLLKVSETAKKYPSHLLFGDPPPRKETKE